MSGVVSGVIGVVVVLMDVSLFSTIGGSVELRVGVSEERERGRETKVRERKREKGHGSQL